MSDDPEMKACAKPLVELLEAVPFDARLTYEHSPTHHQMIAVGSLCSLAALALRTRSNTEIVELLRECRQFIQDERDCLVECSTMLPEHDLSTLDPYARPDVENADALLTKIDAALATHIEEEG